MSARSSLMRTSSDSRSTPREPELPGLPQQRAAVSPNGRDAVAPSVHASVERRRRRAALSCWGANVGAEQGIQRRGRGPDRHAPIGEEQRRNGHLGIGEPGQFSLRFAISGDVDVADDDPSALERPAHPVTGGAARRAVGEERRRSWQAHRPIERPASRDGERSASATAAGADARVSVDGFTTRRR